MRSDFWLAFGLLGIAAGCAGGPAAGPASSKAAKITPDNLRCEYRIDPSGLGETRPRLSWILEYDKESKSRGLRQRAYRILVTGSQADLAEDKADLWDSGQVESDRMAQVVYAGKPLASRQICW